MDIQSPAAFDLIGDIHGHAQRLRRLLERLGYRESDGVYRHPQRQALFVGDFIDRGPEQLETVNTVRAMVEAGSAQAVLGNHELNALAWYTQDPEAPGTYLRPRTERNRRHHEDFLREVEHRPALHAEVLDWFRTLPLYLDLPGLRMIHACWHADQLAAIAGLLTDDNRLTEAGLYAACRPGTSVYDAVEVLIKGPEAPLPNGHRYQDKTGTWRSDVRVRWWDADAKHLRRAALLDDAERDQLPAVALPAELRPGYADQKPLFIGHYWLEGAPAPLTPKVACLDYSGRDDGLLCAYRWQGETSLSADCFYFVCD
jgi:diadenosine tetraphosphatase ApaH/serine/threonine PP2A family protein phosphatase